MDGGTFGSIVLDVNPVPLPAAVWIGIFGFGALGGAGAVKKIRHKLAVRHRPATDAPR